MSKTTIRLPSASPYVYLAWVRWWRDVEDLLGSAEADLAAAGSPGGSDEAAPDESIVVEHLRTIEAEARAAIRAGRRLIEPELTAEAQGWGQWRDYARKRRDWLETLSLASLPAPEYPADLVTVWKETLRTLRAVVSDDLVLQNVSLVQESDLRSYRLIGELEVGNVEAVIEHLERELEAAHRLRLDVSELTFIDSRGIEMLYRLAVRAEKLSLDPVILASPSKEVERILQIAVPDGIPYIDIQ